MRYFIWILTLLFMVPAFSIKKFLPDLVLDKAEKQARLLKDAAKEQNAIPRSVTAQGEVRWIHDYMNWTEGFWPGICWMLYQHSGNSLWSDAAVWSQKKFAEHRYNSSTHDLGFIFNNSYGKAYRITGEEEYKNILIEAA